MGYEDTFFDEIRNLINECLYKDFNSENYKSYLKLKEMNRIYLEQYGRENGLSLDEKVFLDIVVLSLYADYPQINNASENEFVKLLKHDSDLTDFCKVILNKNQFKFKNETLEIIQNAMNLL